MDGPLNVLGESVVLLDLDQESAKVLHLGGRQGGPRRFIVGDVDIERAARRRDDASALGGDMGAPDGPVVLFDLPLVHFAPAVDDGFTESEIGVDDYFPEVSGNRVDAEGDTGDITGDHRLNHHRHGCCPGVEALPGSIGDRVIRPERGVAVSDPLQDFPVVG